MRPAIRRAIAERLIIVADALHIGDRRIMVRSKAEPLLRFAHRSPLNESFRRLIESAGLEIFGVLGTRLPIRVARPCFGAPGHFTAVADTEQKGTLRPVDVLV